MADNSTEQNNNEVEFIRLTTSDAAIVAPMIFNTFENVHKSKGGTTSDWYDDICFELLYSKYCFVFSRFV